MATVYNRTEYNGRVHPKKFAMWLFIGSLIMMFAGLTSAYIVRMAMGDWEMFRLPEVFTITTFVILFSSATLHWAYIELKKDNQARFRIGLFMTFILGCLFLAGQYYGWMELTSYGIRLNTTPSGSFLYVISGLHAAHIVGGILLLLIFVIKSFIKRNPVQQLLDDVDPERFLGMELLLIYWHFVDFLWLYLFGFFWYNSL